MGWNSANYIFRIKHCSELYSEYTYEAGVRNLEREIGRACRKVARLKAENKRHPSHIAPSSIERFFGPPQFFNLEAERQDEVGVATAIAWTENGGEIMPVEVLLTEGKGKSSNHRSDWGCHAGVGSSSTDFLEVSLKAAESAG